MRSLLIIITMFLTGCASQVEKDHEANSLALVDEWLQALDNSDMDRAWDLTSNITKEREEMTRWLRPVLE